MNLKLIFSTNILNIGTRFQFRYLNWYLIIIIDSYYYYQIVYQKYMLDYRIYVYLSVLLFLIGVIGIIINRKNIIILLMSIELILLSINFFFMVTSVLLDNLNGQIFAFYVLVVAAAESAIGLSILVAYYRVRGSIAIKFINLLKG